jgi:hypothetical protein
MRKMLIPRDVIVLTLVTVDILAHVELIYDLIFLRPTNKDAFVKSRFCSLREHFGRT